MGVFMWKNKMFVKSLTRLQNAQKIESSNYFQYDTIAFFIYFFLFLNVTRKKGKMTTKRLHGFVGSYAVGIHNNVYL